MLLPCAASNSTATGTARGRERPYLTSFVMDAETASSSTPAPIRSPPAGLYATSRRPSRSASRRFTTIKPPATTACSRLGRMLP
jgi:hypothetical protein